VLSADGKDLGEVTDVILLTRARPEAVGYELRSAGGETVFVPIAEQMAVSGDNLRLPPSSTEFVRNDLAGFGAAVTSFRASTLEGAEDQSR